MKCGLSPTHRQRGLPSADDVLVLAMVGRITRHRIQQDSRRVEEIRQLVCVPPNPSRSVVGQFDSGGLHDYGKSMMIVAVLKQEEQRIATI